MHTLTCHNEKCKKTFTHPHPLTRYCSKECNYAAKKKREAAYRAKDRKLGKIQSKHEYRLIQYSGGYIVDELTTRNTNEAQEFYRRNDGYAYTVRVYRDGIKLTYAEADRALGRKDWFSIQKAGGT